MDNRQEQVDQVKQEQHRLKTAAHEQWLQHPVTVELLRGLNNHANKLIDVSVEDAVRTLAAVRTVRTLQKWIVDSEQFINLTN